jgi:hypothetical protein
VRRADPYPDKFRSTPIVPLSFRRTKGNPTTGDESDAKRNLDGEEFSELVDHLIEASRTNSAISYVCLRLKRVGKDREAIELLGLLARLRGLVYLMQQLVSLLAAY